MQEGKLEAVANALDPRASNSPDRLADLKQFSENWIWRAAEVLVEAPDFQPSPKWTAKRLNISVEKVVDAFEGLERLGFIVREGSSFKKSDPKSLTNVNQRNLGADDLIAIHAKLAPQIISMLSSESKFTSRFLLADDALISKYSPEFVKLYEQMRLEGLENGCTQLVASEMSFAILSKDGENGGIQ